MGAFWDTVLPVDLVDRKSMDGSFRLGVLPELMRGIFPSFV